MQKGTSGRLLSLEITSKEGLRISINRRPKDLKVSHTLNVHSNVHSHDLLDAKRNVILFLEMPRRFRSFPIPELGTLEERQVGRQHRYVYDNSHQAKPKA